MDGGVVTVTSQPERADRPNAGGYPPSMPGGQTSDAFHLYREVDRLERSVAENARRIDTLDAHGSRGVEALKGQIEAIRKDFLDHEGMHSEAALLAREAAQQAASARRWVIGVVIGLITPLYPILLFLIFGWRAH